jgi:TIR domain
LHSLPDIDQAILMKIGNRDRFKQHVYRFKAANESLRSSGFHPYTSAENWGAALGESELAVFHDAYVVVGSLDSDRPETIDRSGPELVAWALSDFVDRDPRSAREVWAAPALLALLVMIFSVLAAFTFRELFNRFIRVPPSIIALIAFLTTLTYLFLLVKGLLAWKHIYVQSALVVVAIAIACLLAWRYAKGLMHHGFWHGSDAFDIFISYANDPENLNWVTKHLYEPLIHVRKANGSRLRMFFDKRSIEPGDYWYSVLARAINGSRLFVAVYSADYFDRDGCRFEMMRAARKHLSQTDFIFPIARVIPVPKLPVEYDHIQFCAGSDADALAECIEKIKRIVGAAGNDNVSRIASLENRAPLG